VEFQPIKIELEEIRMENDLLSRVKDNLSERHQ
jgi:hypothetical protein